MGDCCVSDAKRQRKCQCRNSGISQCQRWCTEDVRCKGYSFNILEDSGKYCKLATTTSPCPTSCSLVNIHERKNIQTLDPNAKCGEYKRINRYVTVVIPSSGCFIKRRGMLADVIGEFSLTDNCTFLAYSSK